MTVRNYMTPNPIVVSPNTTVAEIARLFVAHRIGCVPVVDKRGTMVGLVTETDLFLREKAAPFSAVKLPTLMGDWLDPSRLEEAYRVLRNLTAKDVMRSPVMTVDAEVSIGHAAHQMMLHDRKHLPVTGAGKLVGILTRHDVLRALCGRVVARREPPEDFAVAI